MLYNYKNAKYNENTWVAERTLDEVAVGAKYREVALRQTERSKELGEGPIEMSPKDSFIYDLGDEYCTTESVLVESEEAR